MKQEIQLQLNQKMHSLGDLLPIHTNKDNQQFAYGREIHNQLGIKSRYNDWANAYIKTDDFEEGTDYEAVTKFLVTAQGNRSKYTDHKLTIDTAKEILMMQHTELGRKVRRYLIAVESAYTRIRDNYLADQQVKEELEHQAIIDADKREIARLKEQNMKNNGAARTVQKFLRETNGHVYDDTEVYQAIIATGGKISIAQMWKDLHKEGYIKNRKQCSSPYHILTQKGIDTGWFSYRLFNATQTKQVATLGFTTAGIIAMEKKYNLPKAPAKTKTKHEKFDPEQSIINIALATVHGLTMGNMEASKALLRKHHISF